MRQCFNNVLAFKKALMVKVKSAYEPIVAHPAGAYLCFCSMERLGIFLLPPEWNASPSQGYPLN